MNRVILIGHVGRDPEIRNTQSGDTIANFSLATSESWNDRASGERKERTEWHRVVVFNSVLAGVVEKYVRKGSHLLVEGTLQTRKWTDQQGIERYSTEVVVGPFKSTVLLLGDRTDRDAGGREPTTRETAAPARSHAAAKHPAGWEPSASNASDLDDAIPF
jgi:single-strand DNA-binding protein